MTPDVNVLVAGFRTDHTHHIRARQWLSQARDECAHGHATLTLLPMVATAFLRLVTNPRVFAQPDTIEDAVGFLDAILETPGAELGFCGPEWPQLRDRMLKLGLRGNLVTDAWIAAAAQSQSERLVTFDRDFLQLLPTTDLTLLEGS